jgi:UPF0755 protein
MDFFIRNKQWIVLCSFAVLSSGTVLTLAPPSSFPTHATVNIERGSSVSAVAEELADAHVVRSASILSLILRFSGASSRVQAGSYLFDSRQSALVVAKRLITGDYGLPPVQITFPEGVTARDIAEKVARALPTVRAGDVLALGKPEEGYLFPDTYLLSPDASAQSILDLMRANFNDKTEPLTADVQASGHSLSDIVTLASLVEKEARTVDNRTLVAGVLWNRLAKKMPLQVDAVFGYIFDRDTYSPSFTDLKVDSPYNTYTHIGLPPGPICNPGLESILAALHPTPTKYLYYLTDKNGVMHYATTFTKHQANQAKYLH